MPIPGGVSDKFGNRFEGRWTVWSIATVLAETASSIWLEPWDQTGEGIEFTVRTDDGSAHHQVKRQVSGAVQWTLGRLEKEGVLSAARGHLLDPDARFVFVSSSSSQLHDLAETATTADSYESFRAQLNEKDAIAFEFLAQSWTPWTEPEAYQALRRVEVPIIDEATLKKAVQGHLASLVEGDPERVLDILAAFALDHLTQNVGAESLWAHLKGRGHAPREWWRNDSIVLRVTEQRVRVLREASRSLIAGGVIEREQVKTLAQPLPLNPPSRLVIAVGDAGTGKSVVLAEVARQADAAGTLVLPLRVDRLVTGGRNPRSAAELGQDLGLPASPAAVLANLARGRQALLVVDQLDAMSLISARNPTGFEAIDELIREALGYSNLSVLVACRRYDLENDPRLRTLREPDVQLVDIGSFTLDQVTAALSAAGAATASFTKHQLDLLSNALNLRLLLDSGDLSGGWFEKRKDLFDRYWDHKRRLVTERLEREAHWKEVIDKLTSEIDRARALTVPFTVLDQWQLDAEAMVSEGVLVRDGPFVAFAHQAFFDYAFAREFVARGEDVLPFLLAGRQQLFQRAQLREILTHLRDVDPDRFLRAVREVLGRVDVRFHLKDAVLALLAELRDPSAGEWALVREGIRDMPEAVANRLRAMIASRAAWFDLALGSRWVRDGLASTDPKVVADYVTIVGRGQRQRPREVGTILIPYVGAGGEWPARLSWVVSMADLTLDDTFMELVLQAIQAGDLDGLQPFASNGTFWDEAYTLARTKPAWAAAFARAYLDRCMALGPPGQEVETLDAIPEPLDREFFSVIAGKEPQAYLDELLPWVLEVADATTRPGTSKHDAFSVRWPGDPLSLQDGLLDGIDRAFRAIASVHPEALANWQAVLSSSTSETGNYLLIRLGTAEPAALGVEVARILAAEPARLQASIGSDYHWAAREFMSAVCTSLPAELRVQLQSVLLDYYPTWERSRRGRASHGEAQWKLLSACPSEYLTEGAKRRLLELSHKFGSEVPLPPTGTHGGFIGSPVPEEVADRLTDDQWMGAIRRYQSDTIDWGKPVGRAGGVRQLAQTLYGRTVAEPARFAALAASFPDEVPSPYMDEVLRGLSDTTTEISFSEVFAVCQRAHELPDRPCGRWIADVISKRAQEDLPQTAIDMVVWYATTARDPESSSRAMGGDRMTESALIDSQALNSDRGRALLAIAELIRGDGSRIDHIRPSVTAAASDAVDGVRAAAAEALVALLAWDPAFVATTLRTLVTGMPDALLASRPVTRLLAHFAQTDWPKWRVLVERMLASKDDYVSRLGAQIAQLAAIGTRAARKTAKAALRGPEAQRRGIADVAAAHIGDPTWSATAESLATTLFLDSSQVVRQEAATAVSSLPPDALGAHETLLRAFIASPAFDDQPGIFFHHLAESATVSPELALEACSRFVASSRGAAGDIRTAAAGSAGDVSRVAVRAHDQGDNATKEVALDVIDELLKVAAYGINDAIGQYER